MKRSLWTTSDLRTARELWERGRNYPEIGQAIGRHRTSVARYLRPWLKVGGRVIEREHEVVEKQRHPSSSLEDFLARRPAAAACRLHWFDLKRAHAQPYPSYANPSSGIYERPRGEVTAVGLYGSPGAACSDWAQE